MPTNFFNQDNIDEAMVNQEPAMLLFGKSGEPIKDLEINATAKTAKYESTTKYFVKAGGSNISLFHPRRDALSQLDRRKKANDAYFFKWIEVDKKCFDLYLTFLQTGNDYLYTQASMATR